MNSSSRGPLFVWACLPDQPDLTGVYTALARIGCDNISFVSDLARIPLQLREESPMKEGLPKDSPSLSFRPASSHTVSFSDSSCSRSITPPSSAAGITQIREEPASPNNVSLSEVNDEAESVILDCDVKEDEEEHENVNVNRMAHFSALASFFGGGPPTQVAPNVIQLANNPADDTQNESTSSIDLSFLRNVPCSEGKEKCVTCKICEKSFSRNARNVSRHAATHFPRAAARYTCGKCGEAFGRNDRAKYHVDTKHNGNAELHDKAKDSEYSEEWVKAVKQCFPGFDFSPRDTHSRGGNTPLDAIDVTYANNGRLKVNCKLCSWVLYPCSPTSFAVEHAVSHLPPQFTCSLCGEQSESKDLMTVHATQRHPGKQADVIDDSAKNDERIREFALMCFPSRAEDMEKALEDRIKLGAKKRRIDSLIESKKKVMKMG